MAQVHSSETQTRVQLRVSCMRLRFVVCGCHALYARIQEWNFISLGPLALPVAAHQIRVTLSAVDITTQGGYVDGLSLRVFGRHLVSLPWLTRAPVERAHRSRLLPLRKTVSTP